jgi:ABC-type nitrate/sulfonate/bicarbonate transport system substrate-binding protein
MQERVRGKSGIERDSGGHRTAVLSCGRSRLARWVGVLGVVLGIVACSEPVRPPLVVGINTWVGYDPLVLARDRGLTDARQVKVVELISSAEALRHLRNGLLDAAGLTLDEALRLVDSGFDVRIVALLDTSAGADPVLAAPRITRSIFDSRQMPGEIVDVLVVRTEVLRQRPEAVDALLAAWAGGLNLMQLDPPGAAASLAPGADLSPAQYQAVLRGLRFYSPAESLALLTGGDPPRVARQGQEVARLLVELGLLRQPPNWAALIDTVPAARAPTTGPLP